MNEPNVFYISKKKMRLSTLVFLPVIALFLAVLILDDFVFHSIHLLFYFLIVFFIFFLIYIWTPYPYKNPILIVDSLGFQQSTKRNLLPKVSWSEVKIIQSVTYLNSHAIGINLFETEKYVKQLSPFLQKAFKLDFDLRGYHIIIMVKMLDSNRETIHQVMNAYLMNYREEHIEDHTKERGIYASI